MIKVAQLVQGTNQCAAVDQRRHPVADRHQRVQVVGDHDHGQAEAALQAAGSAGRTRRRRSGRGRRSARRGTGSPGPAPGRGPARRACACRRTAPAGYLWQASRGRPTRASLSPASWSSSASGSASRSRSGAWMFCPTVSELNSAPSWNSTPWRACSARRSASLEAARGRGRAPRSGRAPAACSPRISRSSTDLPVPEPPTMPNTSPRRTSRSSSSCTHLRAEPGAQPLDPDHAAARSPPVTRRDTRTGSRTAHRRRSPGRSPTTTARVVIRPTLSALPLDAQPLVAADHRDQEGEHRRLDEADQEGLDVDRLARAGRGTGRARCRARRRTSGRRRAGARMSAKNASSGSAIISASRRGNDQDLDRVEAEGAQRIDLLVDLHRADLRGEGAARAAGDHDRGQQDADLAQDRDARAGRP